jgi:RimJ/RimL family protein N-acetyltransferase
VELSGPDAVSAITASDALGPAFRTHLRLARDDVDDAEYIWRLRSDPLLNLHLSPSSPDIGAQLAWLRGYKLREARGEEFYFVIVCDRARSGVIRMYDFRMIDGRSSFGAGSWIIPPPRPDGLVTYTIVTVCELGFDVLGFEHAHFQVRKSNAGVISFHQRIGARPVSEDEEHVFFVYSPDDYARLRHASARQIALHRVRLADPSAGGSP